MRKILLTGASGFIGKQVLNNLLERGYSVTAINFKNKIDTKHPNLNVFSLDLLNYSNIKKLIENEKFTDLLHFAWYGDSKCHTHNINLDWNSASLYLLKLFAENDGKQVLMAGSVSEYDFKYGYLTEDISPITNSTLYGKAKSTLYTLAEAYCKQNNINFKWARIFNLYGQNERPQRLMPSVINSCLRGEDVIVSDCLKFQDYLHVKDVASGIISIFESDMTGAVNVCSAKPVQLRNIVNKIAELTNFQGNICWGAIPSAFGDDIVVGNNDKLKSTGWVQKYSLEEGLSETINWWKEKNKGDVIYV